MDKMTIRDIEVTGKKVLVRVDFNVPVDKERNITDDSRIQSALPTIGYLVNRGAKVIRQDKTRTFRYPSRRAFLDEITWLFWRARREAAS